MHIGSWPGTLKSNAFLQILANALANAGARFVPIKHPSDGVIPSVDALLIQWPDEIFWNARRGSVPYRAALAELRALNKWRKAGTKLIWIVHNAVPHDLDADQLRLWSLYSRGLSLLVHGYMTLSPSTLSSVLRAHPDLGAKPAGSFPHPSYASVLRSQDERACQRAKLGIPADAFVIGALGRISHYKGLPELIEAFRAIDDGRLRLVIHGRPKNASALAAVTTAMTNDPRILAHFERLTDEDFALTASACDAIVAPYREYLHSGVLVYSVCAERRLLTPRTPFAEDLANSVGPGWINLYDDQLTPSLLSKFITSPIEPQKPDISALDPLLAAQAILKFVAGIML